MHVIDHGFGERGGGRDGIPGQHRNPCEHAANGGCGIAVNQNLSRRLVHAGHAEALELLEILLGVIHAGADRVPVERQRLGLAAELLVQGFFGLRQIDVEQVRQDAHVDHVAHQAPQPRVGADRSYQLVKRHGIKRQVGAKRFQIQWLVVDHSRGGLKIHHVFPRRLRVHRHQKVDLLLAGNVAVVVGADGVPGGQARNIRRENVLAGNGNSHLKDRPQQDGIGGLAPGAVHRRHLDAHVIDDALMP